MLGAPRGPGEGKLHHKVSASRKSRLGTQVGVGHGCLASLDEPPAHGADHQPLLPRKLPHTGEQVGVAAMEGIEFTDHTRYAHGWTPFLIIHTSIPQKALLCQGLRAIFIKTEPRKTNILKNKS